MNRCLILIASAILTFVTISSAASAVASDWPRVAHVPNLGGPALAGSDESGGTSIAPWATIPSPRMFAFVQLRF